MTQLDQAGFTSLPYEILQLIFDYIFCPSDLQTLCLVSKHVSELAFRQLYRNIVIPERLDDPTWSRIETLAESSHLHEIQSLQLGVWPTCQDQPRYCENLNLLITKLRPHSLHSFAYETICRPRSDYLVLLWKKQRKLKKLYFDFKICAPSINEIASRHKADLQALSEIEELEIDFASEGDREASMLFDCLNLKSLRKITLESVVPKSLRTATPAFGSMAFTAQLPRTLTHMCFRQFSLAPPSVWQLHDFNCLESFTLSDCHNVDPVLNSFRPTRLKHLHIIDTDAQAETLAECLSSFDSLESLSVVVPWATNIPNVDRMLVDAISCHRKQLRSLRFSPPVRGMATSSLYHLLSQCQLLQTMILGSGLWRLTRDAKSIYEEAPELDPTYISFMYRPQNFTNDFKKLQRAWKKVMLSNAGMIFALNVAPPTLKLLGFEYRDRILYGGAHFYASELARNSCFTRPEYAPFYAAKHPGTSQKSPSLASPFAVQVDPALVPYVLPEVYVT